MGGWFLWWLLEIEIYTICTPFMTCFTLHMKNIICKLYSNIIMDWFECRYIFEQGYSGLIPTSQLIWWMWDVRCVCRPRWMVMIKFRIEIQPCLNCTYINLHVFPEKYCFPRNSLYWHIYANILGWMPDRPLRAIWSWYR